MTLKSALMPLRLLYWRALSSLQGDTYARLIRRLSRNEILLRRATFADAKGIYRLRLPYLRRGVGVIPFCEYDHHFRITEKSRVTFVAEVQGTVIGAVDLVKLAGKTTKTSRIMAMRIRRRYRRLGIGERILNLALDEAWRQGREQVILLADRRNRAALTLYQKCGFVEATYGDDPVNKADRCWFEITNPRSQ